MILTPDLFLAKQGLDIWGKPKIGTATTTGGIPS